MPLEKPLPLITRSSKPTQGSRQNTPRMQKLNREWDSTINNLEKMKLTPQEIKRRKELIHPSLHLPNSDGKIPSSSSVQDLFSSQTSSPLGTLRRPLSASKIDPKRVQQLLDRFEENSENSSSFNASSSSPLRHPMENMKQEVDFEQEMDAFQKRFPQVKKSARPSSSQNAAKKSTGMMLDMAPFVEDMKDVVRAIEKLHHILDRQNMTHTPDSLSEQKPNEAFSMWLRSLTEMTHAVADEAMKYRLSSDKTKKAQDASLKKLDKAEGIIGKLEKEVMALTEDNHILTERVMELEAKVDEYTQQYRETDYRLQLLMKDASRDAILATVQDLMFPDSYKPNISTFDDQEKDLTLSAIGGPSERDEDERDNDPIIVTKHDDYDINAFLSSQQKYGRGMKRSPAFENLPSLRQQSPSDNEKCRDENEIDGKDAFWISF